MRILLLNILILTSLSSALGQSLIFPVDTLLYNGSVRNRLNIAIIGEGYLAEDANVFVEDAKAVVEAMRTSSPFKEYISYMNVVAISVPSVEEGAGNSSTEQIDNFFGTYYSPRGLPTGTNRGILSSVLSRNFPAYDQMLVLVNDTRGGGLAYFNSDFAIIGKARGFEYVALHEFGHSIGGLGDEYAAPISRSERANVTATSTSDYIKWKNWLKEPSIGIFPINSAGSWNKPAKVCSMNGPSGVFCHVCIEGFVVEFYDHVTPIDSYGPNTYSGDNETLEFELTQLKPEPNTIKSFWILDEDTLSHNNSSFSIISNALSEGTHTLSTNLVDTTSLSRKDDLELYSVIWTIDKNGNHVDITSATNRRMVERTDFYPVDWIVEEELHDTVVKMSAFPNPFSNEVIINFNNPFTDYFELQLMNLQGKIFNSEVVPRLKVGEHSFTIDTSELGRGLFLVKMRLGDQTFFRKLLK